MEILIPKDRKWKISILCGLVTLTLYFATIVGKPLTPGYAPHMFAYNVTFLFPLTILIFIFSIATVTFYFKIEKEQRKEFKIIHKTFPFLLILIPTLELMKMLVMLFLIMTGRK